MKKHIVIAVFATVLLAASGFAEARDGQRGYRANHYAGYSHGARHYGRHYYPRHHYRGHRYHHRRHDYRKGLKIAAGAIVLGSLIHAVTHDRRDRVVYRERHVRAPSANDYWYRLDNEGQCVEVHLNDRGQEVWTYVDQGNCE